MAGTRRHKRSIRKTRRVDVERARKPMDRKPYEDLVKDNGDFVKYYQAQGFLPETEWEEFMTAMRTDLPTAFRIMAATPESARRLLAIVEGQFFKELLNQERGEGEGEAPVKQPFPLPWYPDRLGWQVEISRKDIRRSEAYFRLHNFLMAETACGAISRQEAVSMIPPLLLGVQPHHKVLDMCAAPGSKTAQLIEQLHSGTTGIPDGLVIANDIDNSRCYMLVHQAKRLNSPCIVITNHDSSAMPNIFFTKPDGAKAALKFDRILCDVPCSGDGTLRKNPDIWKKWNTANANNLHGVQYRIIRRGLELLEVGGVLVYSTCSLNPVENEAVMSRILQDSAGSVELQESASRVPGLKHRPGLTTWKVASRDLVVYSDFSEVPEKWETQVRPSMFPPSAEALEELHLERCLRIFPHDQDSGAFFVAVLKKTSSLPWESVQQPAKDSSETVPETESSSGAAPEIRREPERKRRRIQGYREDPYCFFAEDEPVWLSIREFYDIKGLAPKCLLTRCATGKKKNIYFVSPQVRDIVVNNQDRVKIINTGVKAFARCDNKHMGCCFRLVQEGLESIVGYTGVQRRLDICKDDMISLLQHNDPNSPLDVETLSESTKKSIENLGVGSCVLDVQTDELSLSLVGWRGSRSLRAYVPLPDAVHFLRLLGGDVTKFEVNKFKKATEESSAEPGKEEESTETAEAKMEESTETAETKLEESTVV